jgi:dTDP-4-dehydrorhamnose reductase
VQVEGITTAQVPTPARRPANSRLDTSKLAHDHGVHFPAWSDALAVILDDLIGPQVPLREGVAS